MGWQALVRLRGVSSATVPTSNGDDEKFITHDDNLRRSLYEKNYRGKTIDLAAICSMACSHLSTISTDLRQVSIL